MARASRPRGAMILAAILCTQVVGAGEAGVEAIDHRGRVDATS